MLFRPQDAREMFQVRLRAAVRGGVPLGNFRSQAVIDTWLDICEPISRTEALTLIPDTLEDFEHERDLTERLALCGLAGRSEKFRRGLGAYVACYKHMRERQPAEDDFAGRLLGLGARFAALKEDFRFVIDGAEALHMEQDRQATLVDRLEDEIRLLRAEVETDLAAPLAA